MPIHHEVDDLEKQVSFLEDEIRKRKKRIDQFKKEIKDANEFVIKCKFGRDLCLKNLKRIKNEYVVQFNDYKGMLKLYQDNCDLLIQYQALLASKMNEVKSLETEQIPFLDASIVELKRRLGQWGQVFLFKRL